MYSIRPNADLIKIDTNAILVMLHDDSNTSVQINCFQAKKQVTLFFSPQTYSIFNTAHTVKVGEENNKTA